MVIVATSQATMSQDTGASGNNSSSKDSEDETDKKTQKSIVASVTNGDPESDKLVKVYSSIKN